MKKHLNTVVRKSSKENKSILIPEGFAHGFYTLTNDVVLHYKCSNYREKNSEAGILWNDKTLKINWKIKKPILSTRDQVHPSIKDAFKIKK